MSDVANENHQIRPMNNPAGGRESELSERCKIDRKLALRLVSIARVIKVCLKTRLHKGDDPGVLTRAWSFQNISICTEAPPIC